MKIAADDIVGWAQSATGPTELPRLVRRLMHGPGGVSFISVPAGDATNQPGWDGRIVAKAGNAWVPAGSSFWELSCRQDVGTKANEDYRKRTAETEHADRQQATFVFVSGCRWPRKRAWIDQKNNTQEWKEVRAYDADDLEQWLEFETPVALQFAEDIGLSGPGVESPRRYWETWAARTQEHLSVKAFLLGREPAKETLIERLNGGLSGSSSRLNVKADSVEEAVAFVCMAMLEQDELLTNAIVVTTEDGWRYVDAHKRCRIAIAARPELASRPSAHGRLTVVVPCSAGDVSGPLDRSDVSAITLRRPELHEFETALMELGLDEGHAKRLARATGRSWSVFVRQRSRSPAASRPSWLNCPEAGSLSVVCLVGAWSDEKAADTSQLEVIAQRPYADIARELAVLANLDDSPVIRIGPVWKAKSSIELLALFGSRLTAEDVERFLTCLRCILEENDPQLELARDERYMAGIYGKTRPYSEYFLDSMTDSLVKLAVRGSELPELRHLHFDARIHRFVRDLLENASATRWLSLDAFLPDLAEAAPDAFLQSVEQSLNFPNPSVLALFQETSSSPLLGRCWHANLLCALERLAWAPQRVTRVARLLARLSKVEIGGNWQNTPFNSLVDIFRSWRPQTAANITQRIAAFRNLASAEPDVAFKLGNALTPIECDVAWPSARPRWRDDDAGAGGDATKDEIREMVTAAADLMLELAPGHADRIAQLVEKTHKLDDERISRLLSLCHVYTLPEANDFDRFKIQNAIRTHIHRMRNWGGISQADCEQHLAPFQEVYAALCPNDIVLRHAWLFLDGWIPLPEKDLEDYRKQNQIVFIKQKDAASEVFSQEGFAGLLRLANICAPSKCAWVISQINISRDSIRDWLVGYWPEADPPIWLSHFIKDFLRCLGENVSALIIKDIHCNASRSEWKTDRLVRLLTLAPFTNVTWDIVDALGPNVIEAYWLAVKAEWLDDALSVRRAVGHLLKNNRPRSALAAARFKFGDIQSDVLMETVEQYLVGQEPGGPMPKEWHLTKLIDILEGRDDIDRDRLARIEFGLMGVLTLSYGSTYEPTTLYDAVMTQPELFVELLKMTFKSDHGDRETEISDDRRDVARIAWTVLHRCRRQPGCSANGVFEVGKYIDFVDSTRRLANEAGWLTACDISLGQIMAHSPNGQDGRWPCEPVREILDRQDAECLRKHFVMGCLNKSGITSRPYNEGGDQERALADEYRSHADSIRFEFPFLASALDSVSDHYKHDSFREDFDARLRSEGYYC